MDKEGLNTILTNWLDEYFTSESIKMLEGQIRECFEDNRKD